MDNEKPQPLVTIYCDIVEDTDANIDSDSVDLVTPTQQSVDVDFNITPSICADLCRRISWYLAPF